MSTFSKNDGIIDEVNTKLPDIGRGNGPSDLRQISITNGQGGIADIQSPIEINKHG
jgi:hypothetical protein